MRTAHMCWPLPLRMCDLCSLQEAALAAERAHHAELAALQRRLKLAEGMLVMRRRMATAAANGATPGDVAFTNRNRYWVPDDKVCVHAL